MTDLNFYNVADLAAKLGMHIMVLDLETTTFRGRPSFGITEVACFVVTKQGPGVQMQSLINPERSISPEAQALTGITPAMVAKAPTWAEAYGPFFRDNADLYWFTGFNCNTFDFPAIFDINERYGMTVENKFPFVFDVFTLHLKLSGTKGRKGNLSTIASIYGIVPRGDLHRAMADTVLTLEVLNAIIGTYGVDTVFDEIHKQLKAKKPSSRVASKPDTATVSSVSTESASSAKVSDDELATTITELSFEHSPLTLAHLALVLDSTEEDIGWGVSKLIDQGAVAADLFEDAQVQAWLPSALAEVSPQVLADGKLGPIMLAVKAHASASPDLDYIQLRIGLLNAGHRWLTLKA